MRNLQVVLIVLVSFFCYAAEPSITMNEADFRATIRDRDITITIPITSNLTGAPASKLKLELLDPADKVVTTADLDRPLKRGRYVHTLVLVKPEPKKFE